MTKTEIIKLFVAVIIFAVVIAIIAVLGRIDATQTIQLIITFVLVLVTVAYVKRTAEIASATREQANASVEMAEAMKDATFAALKPIVSIDWISGQRGRAFTPYFNNIGLGPALNVKFYCTHTSFEFKSKQDRTTLEVGKREHITLLSEDFDFKDWAGFAFNCDYQSIYGENFRSILVFKTEQERNLEISELR